MAAVNGLAVSSWIVGTNYYVDTDGNVYKRLKPQGLESNRRFHLWNGKSVYHVYVSEIKKALQQQARARLFSAIDPEIV